MSNTQNSLLMLWHSVGTLGHVENAAANCRSKVSQYLEFAEMPQQHVETAQCRVTTVPVLEAALAVYATITAASKQLAGTKYFGLVAALTAVIEPTLELRIWEVIKLGHRYSDSALTRYRALLPSDAENHLSVEEIRANPKYRFSFEVCSLERQLQMAWTECKESGLPLKKFLCTYLGGDRDWQPVEVEAIDQYRARLIAIAGWLGVYVKEVGLQHEMIMRFTSMTEVED